MEIKMQKVITFIGSVGNGSNTFSYSVNNLNFIPDEVRLKYVAKYDNDVDDSDNFVVLKSELSDNNIMMTFPKVDVFYQNCDIPWTLKYPVNGKINFQFTQIDGTVPSNIDTFDTNIALTFLFIKYEDKI